MGQPQHLATFGIIEELPLSVQQFESVPLPGIVARGDDDAAVGPFGHDRHLHARRRAKPEVDHIHSAPDQSTFHKAVDHLARDTGIAPYGHHRPARGDTAQYPLRISGGKTDHIGRRQVVARLTAYGPPYS